jgi:hypothetical protein
LNKKKLTRLENVSEICFTFYEQCHEEVTIIVSPMNTYNDEALIPMCYNKVTAEHARHAVGGEVNTRVRIVVSGVWILRKTLLSTSEIQNLKVYTDRLQRLNVRV